LQLQRTRLAGVEQRLLALNPLAVLARGFSVVTDEQGQVVRRVAQVQPGASVRVRVSDGRFGAQVTEVETNGKPAAV
jgi:exodeoxyribonuclease VII large subunit